MERAYRRWIKAIELRDKTFSNIGKVPALLLVNKCDLQSKWEVKPQRPRAVPKWLDDPFTSAKNGEGVEEAFAQLTALMMTGTSKVDNVRG